MCLLGNTYFTECVLQFVMNAKRVRKTSSFIVVFPPKKLCIFYERCRKKRASRFHSCFVAKNGRRNVRYFLGGAHTLQMAGKFLMYFDVFFLDLNL